MNLREEEQPIYLRFFQHLFGRKKKNERLLLNLEKQQKNTPFQLVLRSFVTNKAAVVGLVLFITLLLMVTVVPMFIPFQSSYQEVTQQNVPPGRNLLKVPKQLQGKVLQISVGSTFSVGISNEGEVFLWGEYSKSIKNIPESMGNLVQISAGLNHILALNEQGVLYAWGSNRFGQTEIPAEVLGRTDIVQIAAGNQCSMAVTKSGELYYWGNRNLMDFAIGLYQGQISQVVSNTASVLGLLHDGSVVYLGKRTSVWKDIPRFRDRIIDIALTAKNAYALDRNGMLYQWGEDGRKEWRLEGSYEVSAEDNELGNENAYAEPIGESERGNVEVAEKVTSKVIIEYGSGGGERNSEDTDAGYGSGEKEQKMKDSILEIEAGRYHVTARSQSGKVMCFGEDHFGVISPPKVLLNGSKSVKQIHCGYYQNYAVAGDGTVTTWGLSGYLFGTDGYGRDIFTRMMIGGRLTMTIGVVAVIIQTIIGILVGGISGYYGGRVDNLCMRFTEVVNALPFLPFAMILSAMIGNKLTSMQRIYLIMVVLGVLNWPGMARLVRAQVLAEKNKEFVTAAKAIGNRQGHIIWHHILPNIMSFVIVSAASSFAASMLTESSLSFLGFGVIEPNPTWGNMLTGAQSSTIIRTYWWRWVFPAAALSIATISINLVGDGLRDAIDPKGKG